MKKTLALLSCLAFLALGVLVGRGERAADKAVFPSFRMQEIETTLKVGYGVILADLNGDGKQDIVVVDTTRILWYENPSWKKRTIIQGLTKPDNVSIAAADIDGDGQLDLALAAGWRFLDTKNLSTLQWLKRGKTLDQSWTVHPIATEEVSIHRIRLDDIDGDGKPELLVAPALGKSSTGAKNWMDGEPVRILSYKIPKDPVRGPWVPDVLDNSLHVVHNFWAGSGPAGNPNDILLASYEGVNLLTRKGGKWNRQQIGAGYQVDPKGSRGASEIKFAHLNRGKNKFLAAIEPFHGHQVVVYTPPADPAQPMWNRQVLDEKLKWGHGVWCADLDNDGSQEVIIAIRDDLSKKPQERRGIRLYKAVDAKGTKWERSILEAGGIACEDLLAGDLDGDGRLDIVAAGRQTHNLRIYWNEGVKQ